MERNTTTQTEQAKMTKAQREAKGIGVSVGDLSAAYHFASMAARYPGSENWKKTAMDELLGDSRMLTIPEATVAWNTAKGLVAQGADMEEEIAI